MRDKSIFYVKTTTQPPYLSQKPPSEILRSEVWDPVKPLLFENLVEGSTPRRLQQKERRSAHSTLWSLFELKYDDTIDISTIIEKLKDISRNRRFLISEVEKIV